MAGGAAPKKSRFGRGKKKDTPTAGGEGGPHAGMDGAMQSAQQQAEMLKTVVGPMESELAALRERLVLESRRSAAAEAAALLAAATGGGRESTGQTKDASADAGAKAFQAAEAIALAAARRRGGAPPNAAASDGVVPNPYAAPAGAGTRSLPADVPDRIQIAQLEHQLVLEQSARADLAIQSQVQVTQRGVLLGELESCRLELGRERSAHADLKYTWSLANDHFLESQVALSERASSLEQQLDAVKEAAGFVSKSIASHPELDATLQIAELEQKIAQAQEASIAKLTEHDKLREGRTAGMANEFAAAQRQWHQQKKQLVSEIQVGHPSSFVFLPSLPSLLSRFLPSPSFLYFFFFFFFFSSFLSLSPFFYCVKMRSACPLGRLSGA